MHAQRQTKAAPADRVPIADLRPDTRVVGCYLCTNKEIATTRDGREFLRLVLRDATGEVKALQFDPADDVLEELRAGHVVKIVGQYTASQQYGPQIKLQQLYLLGDGEYDPACLVPVSPVPLDDLERRLDELLDSVVDPGLRALVSRALDPEQEPGATFRRAPAAVYHHHAYLYGLLEHSLTVAEAAAAVADKNPRVDRDMVVAGGLLHDIGKTAAYSTDLFRPGLTDEGRLRGEIVIGVGLLERLIREETQLPTETATRLLHIVVSHHGLREKGSPAVPMTREAVVVHYCDDMTARLAAFDETERTTPEGERWTGYNKMLETMLFLGDEGAEEAPTDDPVAGTDDDSSEAGVAPAPSLFD